MSQYLSQVNKVGLFSFYKFFFFFFYKSLIHNILDIQEEKIHGKKSKCVHEPKENAWKQIKLFPY
jgi:hypothetical protein